MWLEFSQHFNGIRWFLEKNWTSNSTLELFTDAAQSVGFGCYFKKHWAQSKWPLSVKPYESAISYLELYPIVVAIDLWGKFMENKRVKFLSDNKAVVEILNKQSSKCPKTMILVRKFVLIALKHNVMFRACYIKGKCNGIADALSRFQNVRFRKLAPKQTR